MARPRKILGGQPVAKTAVVNLADPHAEYFLGFPAERKIGFFAAAAGRVVPAAPAGGGILTATAVGVSPGRMEFVKAGQPFRILVDYAPEPESFRKLYEVVRTMRGDGRVIHLLGSC